MGFSNNNDRETLEYAKRETERELDSAERGFGIYKSLEDEVMVDIYAWKIEQLEDLLRDIERELNSL